MLLAPAQGELSSLASQPLLTLKDVVFWIAMREIVYDAVFIDIVDTRSFAKPR